MMKRAVKRTSKQSCVSYPVYMAFCLFVYTRVFGLKIPMNPPYLFYFSVLLLVTFFLHSSHSHLQTAILSVILLDSFWYCGDCYIEAFFFLSYVIVVQKLLVEIESSHCKGGALTTSTVDVYQQKSAACIFQLVDVRQPFSSRPLFSSKSQLSTIG